MEKFTKIAAFADNFDILFLPKNIAGADFYYLAAKNSSALDWFKENLPEEKILLFEPDDKEKNLGDWDIDELLYHSNITQIIKLHQIDFFAPSLHATKAVYEWSKENNVKLLSTDFNLQNNFENKLYFDQFLKENNLPKPASLVFNAAKSPKTPFEGKFVLQEPTSGGGKGTFFIESEDELKNLLSAGKILPNENYLVRTFIKGETYGITVFIAPGKIALSPCRRQCFYPANKFGKKRFAGIQWIANEFNDNLIQNINSTFFKTGELLYQKKFFGFANFDFIVDGENRINFIECNPRFSAATPQLIQRPKMTSDLPVGKIFVEGFLTPQIYPEKIDYFGYPQTNFNGSVMEINVFPEEENREIIIKKQYQNGLYNYQDRKLSFATPKIEEINDNHQQLFYCSPAVNIGDIFKEDNVVSYIFSNFPLFTKQGEINEEGREVLGTFKF